MQGVWKDEVRRELLQANCGELFSNWLGLIGLVGCVVQCITL
jgi:hypothetical protein